MPLACSITTRDSSPACSCSARARHRAASSMAPSSCSIPAPFVSGTDQAIGAPPRKMRGLQRIEAEAWTGSEAVLHRSTLGTSRPDDDLEPAPRVWSDAAPRLEIRYRLCHNAPVGMGTGAELTAGARRDG